MLANRKGLKTATYDVIVGCIQELPDNVESDVCSIVNRISVNSCGDWRKGLQQTIQKTAMIEARMMAHDMLQRVLDSKLETCPIAWRKLLGFVFRIRSRVDRPYSMYDVFSAKCQRWRSQLQEKEGNSALSHGFDWSVRRTRGGRILEWF